jgi:gluconolactonase
MATLPSWLKIHDPAAGEILGQEPKLDLLLEDKGRPFAHEAGVFIPGHNHLFVTSNQYPHPVTGKAHIHVSRIQLPSEADGTSVQAVEVHVKNVEMANGGVNYKDGVLFCAQGTYDSPGGIAFMSLGRDSNSTEYEAKVLATSFHGRTFNSPNDVVVHSDGSIWFTDPIYGSEQGIRPPPQLPNQVYRFDPATSSIRAIACGFGRPNGICFSPDEKIVYITDTDWIHGDGRTDHTRASHMYVANLFLVPEHADNSSLDLPLT